MGLAAALDLRPPGYSMSARATRWFTGSRVGAGLLAPTLPHLDRWFLRLSGGRFTGSELVGGVPTLFLTTTGARSGLARTTQLVGVPSGDDLAVIGSNFGRRTHPGWVHNLIADPRATASCGGRSAEVIARELTGDEAERVWATARSLNRGFATYPRMVPDRVIRVFQLELVSP